MGYTSKHGRRPMEYASKSSHSQIIMDKDVQAFLKESQVPKKAEEIVIEGDTLVDFAPSAYNPITHIVAIDGGFDEVPIQTEFPSSTLCFFQFGALVFSLDDLEQIGNQPFIEPEDMAKLKQIQRLKLILPVKNFAYKNEPTLTHSARRAVYDFFCQEIDDGEKLIDTLRWFIFQEYDKPASSWILANCPHCETPNIPLIRANMTKQFTFTCTNNNCGETIYLTDVFRLHEAIDDEIGAGGVLSYVMTTFEQIVMLHIIRLFFKLKPGMLKQILFIKDGPLAFFGQTANMHKPMRTLVKYLFDNHNLFMAGLEKSGPFVEHADQIFNKLPDGKILILDNEHIYKYIIPGKGDINQPYGRTTYYSNKLIFKTRLSNLHVVSIPTTQAMTNPKQHDFENLEVILTNIEKLKCDMYDNALLPVALANHLVSLAQFPSSRILQRFAVREMNGKT